MKTATLIKLVLVLPVSLLAGIIALTGCKPQGQPKVSAPSQKVQAELASSENDYDPSYESLEDDGYGVASTCSYEERKKSGQCKPVKLKIKVADQTIDEDVDEVTGKARESLALSIRVEADGSKNKSAVRDYNRLKLGFRGLPEKASSKADDLAGAITWVPKSAVSGTFDVVVRDVGRCIVETAYSKKGVLDDDKSEECEDLEKDDPGSYDQVKTVSYNIAKSEMEEKKEELLKEIDAQCKTATMTNIIGGVPGLLGGDPNAILSIGANAAMGSLECQAAKQKLESDFNSINNMPQLKSE